MTPKEHAARAMLLGLEYRRPVHTYQSRIGHWWQMTGALDADTLRVMERGEVVVRQMKRQTLANYGVPADNLVRKEDTNYDD